ncbi:MAG: DUF881 domain-containing protein [Nostocoides sp.]
MPEPTSEPPPEEVPGIATDPVAPTGGGWRLLARMARPRATKANFFAAIIALSLGFAIATQVHQNQSSNLDSLREDDLVRLLDQVQGDNSRLGAEIQTLQTQRSQLETGVAGSAEARAAAQQRLDSLGILGGTVKARGPGITITIRDPKAGVTAPLLLDALEELRDAGAEAVQYDAIRVVAGTYFTDDENGGISVDGTPLSLPYAIIAIGDAATMASAMDIPGGVSDSVRRVGATIDVAQSTNLTIDALHSIRVPRYARPVAEPTPSAS